MADSRQIEHTAATWLARRSAAPLPERDQQAFDAWLNAASAHRVAYLRLEAAWHEADRAKALAAGIASGQVPARGQWVKVTLDEATYLVNESPMWWRLNTNMTPSQFTPAAAAQSGR